MDDNLNSINKSIYAENNFVNQHTCFYVFGNTSIYAKDGWQKEIYKIF